MLRRIIAVLLLSTVLSSCQAAADEQAVDELAETLALVDSMKRGNAKIQITSTCSLLPFYGSRWIENTDAAFNNPFDTAKQANMVEAYYDLKRVSSEELSKITELHGEGITFPSDEGAEIPFIDEFQAAVWSFNQAIETAYEDAARFGFIDGYGGYFKERHVEKLQAVCDRHEALEVE